MRKVPGEPHCYIRAGAGQVAVTEITPRLLIVITGLSLSGEAQLATVEAGLSGWWRLEVGQHIVVQPGQQDLAAGVVEAAVTVSLPHLAHHRMRSCEVLAGLGSTTASSPLTDDWVGSVLALCWATPGQARLPEI